MYYRFIKITDCNDYRHFVIDMTKMRGYSSYCCFRGEFADFDEVKKKKAHLERFYHEKLIQSKYQPADFSNTVSFLEV